MNIKRLTIKSISRYKSFYRLIAIAIIVAVTVITGSLVVGDSVRNTLLKRVEERLGNTETIIFSRYSFINDTILESSVLKGNSRGILLINGFVSVSGKLTPVMVWGVDDLGIKKGKSKINKSLYNQITPSVGKEIVLRLPAAGMVPIGSMFVTDTYTTSLRLEFDSIVSVEQGGNINLKNEQTIPFNIFVNREELSEVMNTAGKVNVILSDRIISKSDFSSVWNYALSGLKTKNGETGTDIISDRIFIQNKVVETLYKPDSSNRIYSYLANSIRKNNNSIPYSFITAVDQYKGQKLDSNEIILSDYAAKRLNVNVNDTLSVGYFVSKQFKTLIVDSIYLKVGKIVPLEDLQSENILKAEFPGLSNVERCTDWNSDLPINMKLISDEDEDYWKKHKNTPKAIVPYSALAPRWENAYGSATALCTQSSETILNNLTFDMFDIQLIYPRETGMVAAKSGVDFSGLFLSLGFFIIVAAIMLMMVPLSEMLFRRRNEVWLLEATGYPRKRIFKLFFYESFPVVFISAIVGVIIGLAYTYLILFLLGNVWKGATHTEGFKVYPHLSTILFGMIFGIVISSFLVYIGITKSLKRKRHKAKKQTGGIKKLWIAVLITTIFIGLIIVNIFFVKSPMLFLCSGMAFIITGWIWMDYFISKNGKTGRTPFDSSKLIWASLSYTRKQAMLSFITLASGVFIVFSVGLNRQGFADSSQINTATGGFSLWCESSVPVYHNIQTEEGRAKLALKDLPKETHAIQLLKYSADDASCLNLNKVVTPNVLGINMDDLKTSNFKITKTIFNNSAESIYEEFKKSDHKVYPALIDETVLLWGLGKSLGDTIIYEGEKGEMVKIVLAGTLQNSFFQGNILIDKTLFSVIWSEISGSEILLVKVPENKIVETKMLISQALNNYGVRVMDAGERLKMFYSVTDTYLTIFMTLGGLGLLLGIFSFIVVVRKNIIARLKEIALYQSLGFDEKRIIHLLYKENILIPLYAISVGTLGSLLGVSMGVKNVSIWIWILTIFLLVFFILCVMLFVKFYIKIVVSDMRTQQNANNIQIYNPINPNL